MIFKLDFSDIMSAATTLIFVTQISPILFVGDGSLAIEEGRPTKAPSYKVEDTPARPSAPYPSCAAHKACSNTVRTS